VPSDTDRLNTALAGRYTIEKELGRGGMATVYLAHDVKHDRAVALKVMHPELAAALGAERFLREIRIAARLNHPHILPLHDSGEAGGFLFYVMPLVEGESLRDRLRREKQLPVDDALRIAREVADALSYAHAHDVVHRDIKPENILLQGGHAVVADFGIARAVGVAGGEKLTQTGVSIGTPAYMSPEQASGSGDVDGRADLYSLACVLYEMLAGEPPFTGPTMQSVVRQHLVVEAPNITRIRPAVPAEVVAALTRALAKTPADRFNPVALFSEALGGHESRSGASPAAASRAGAPFWRRVDRRVWMAIVVAAAVAGWWISRRVRATPSAESDIRSIAVLPFQERNAQGGEFLGDGMAETLIYALGKVPGFKVAAQTSAFTFRGKEADLATIGEKLGVATVLTGSLQRAGSRLRVTVRLENVATRAQLWTEQYDEELTDVFALQDRIARAVVNHLQASTSRAGSLALVSAGTKNVEAYQAYLQGRYFWGQRGVGIKKGLPFFERAVAFDSSYALAWTGVADSYSLLSAYGDLPVSEAIPKARQAVERALALDSTLAAAHTTLAFILQTNAYDWDGAEREFRRAIALDSTYVIARYWYGAFLSFVRGRNEDGLAENRMAVALDPLSPHAASQLAQALALVDKFDEGIAEGRRAIALAPSWTNYRTLGHVYAQAGRLREAIRVLDSASAMSGQSPWVENYLVAALARSGDSTRARSVFNAMAAKVRSGRYNSMYITQASSWVEGPDAALRWLERQRAEHASSLGWPYGRLLFAPSTVRDLRFAAFWARLNVVPPPGI
jgi:serine/threonine-protein kinase